MNHAVNPSIVRSKGALIGAIVLLVSVVLGYGLIKPSSASDTAPETRSFDVSVKKNLPGMQLPVLSVRKGDTVRINVASATPGMLMIHGFPDMPDVSPGHPAVFNLTADKTGRFSLHLHSEDGIQIEIATIEIRPRD